MSLHHHRQMHQPMQAQRGIALITILVMVALATILAATIAKRQQHTFEQTGYLIQQNQALHYALSAEGFVSELLVFDAENSAATDHLMESWAQPLPPFPVGGAVISAELQDEAGKFNLNSLVKADGTPNEMNLQLFKNMLKRLNLDENLSEAVIDWQDADDLTIGALGAESNFYRGRGYSAANRPFLNIQELRMLRGFEGEAYVALLPYISALPDHNTKINLNTAPALLIASLDERLDLNAVHTALEAHRKKQMHFKAVSDLLSIDPFASMSDKNKTLMNAVLDVKSQFFVAKIEVLQDQRQRKMTSHLQRKNNQVQVYQRSLAPF